MQTLMRVGAPVDDVERVLEAIAPELASPGLAARLHERMRSLSGHWHATAYGEDMILSWPDRPLRQDRR